MTASITDKLAAALRAASYALTELDPLAHQHDAVAIDEALAEYDEVLKDVLPYAIQQFGSDIVHCPHCGA